MLLIKSFNVISVSFIVLKILDVLFVQYVSPTDEK